MGVILCARTDPAFSLQLSGLGIHVYSMEELCYCILKYPLLFLEKRLAGRLPDFLEKGAGEGGLAERLRRQSERSDEPEELLLRLMEWSGYCSAQELSDFRKRIGELRGMSEGERWKGRGDLFFSLRRYGKAVAAYEQALPLLEGRGQEALRGRTLLNEGCACANLFLTEKAFHHFLLAYEILKERAILKKIYFLSRTEPVIEKKERFLKALGAEPDSEWDEEYEEASRRAADGPGRQAVLKAFEGDPIRRAASASAMIRSWKEEYRTML